LFLINRDAQTFVKTINNCISTITTVEWRQNSCDRTIGSIRNSDPTYSINKSSSSSPQRLLSSRSCHVLLPSNFKSFNQKLDNNRRSPSPIWKRRTTPVRRQPLSMNNRRKTLRNSTDC
jgi:hypothetical protein